MSDCRFQFDFTGSGEALVGKIRAKMTEAGGSFEASGSAGSFVLPTPIGTFEGDYTIERGTIRVQVTRKPVFVPCSVIEAKLVEMVRRQS